MGEQRPTKPRWVIFFDHSPLMPPRSIRQKVLSFFISPIPIIVKILPNHKKQLIYNLIVINDIYIYTYTHCICIYIYIIPTHIISYIYISYMIIAHIIAEQNLHSKFNQGHWPEAFRRAWSLASLDTWTPWRFAPGPPGTPGTVEG
jgi:hypothetical protein